MKHKPKNAHISRSKLITFFNQSTESSEHEIYPNSEKFEHFLQLTVASERHIFKTMSAKNLKQNQQVLVFRAIGQAASVFSIQTNVKKFESRQKIKLHQNQH